MLWDCEGWYANDEEQKKALAETESLFPQLRTKIQEAMGKLEAVLVRCHSISCASYLRCFTARFVIAHFVIFSSSTNPLRLQPSKCAVLTKLLLSAY